MKEKKMNIIIMIALKLPLIVKKIACTFLKWFEGDIEYYKENICKYHVSFNDSSENYIDEDNIDMIEVIVF